MTTTTPTIRLRCFEEQKKLRVRIITPGYKNEANCQFPRDIRVKDREYIVPADVIQLRKLGNKWFYYIPKGSITIVKEPIDLSTLKIYGDTNDDDCCICFTNSKDSIFAPCGHYACCKNCSKQLTASSRKCPICRSQINSVIAYIDLS
jgi:hypothetical protein